MEGRLQIDNNTYGRLEIKHACSHAPGNSMSHVSTGAVSVQSTPTRTRYNRLAKVVAKQLTAALR